MKCERFDYFFKILEAGTISEAARQLYISQSALSQYLITLENQLGARLFNRNTTPISLTYEGELYYQTAIKILQMEKDLQRSLDDVKNASLGRITVAMTTMRSQQLLHLLIPRFKERYPAVDISIIHDRNEDLVDLVVNGKADIAFISRSQRRDDLAYIPLAESEILLSAPPQHPIAQQTAGIYDWKDRPPLDLTLVKEEPFIMVKHYPHFSDRIDQILSAYSFQPRVYLYLEDFHTIHQLSVCGVGFAFVHDSSALQNAPQKIGTYFRIDRGPVKYQLNLCYRKNAYLSKLMQGFIETALETCRTLYMPPQKKTVQ